MQSNRHALELARLLENHQTRFVLAESCTAGLVAATLGTIEGISRWMCGSAVVYRDQTKIDWLGVPRALIDRHTSVSAEVTMCLARSALENTSEANLSTAVTGHLGPHAPDALDGTVFIASVWRRDDESLHSEEHRVILRHSARGKRQDEAAEQVIRCMTSVLVQFNGES